MAEMLSCFGSYLEVCIRINLSGNSDDRDC